MFYRVKINFHSIFDFPLLKKKIKKNTNNLRRKSTRGHLNFMHESPINLDQFYPISNITSVHFCNVCDDAFSWFLH